MLATVEMLARDVLEKEQVKYNALIFLVQKRKIDIIKNE